MAKKESGFVNMLLTLVIVTGVASLVLSSVYNLTAEPIAQAREAKRINAIQQVVPDFDSLQTKKYPLPASETDSLEFNVAYKDGSVVGTAVNTFTNKGYSGFISAMVGLRPDGTIIDVVHLQHAETPGLGDKIEKGKSNWSDQFKGLNPRTSKISVAKDGGVIDAITAATITSRAYCDAVSRAYKTYKANVLDPPADDAEENTEDQMVLQ